MILKVKELRKSYGGRPVVNGLSFEVDRGEIVGLLGPNGAGKTTAFYMTIGLVRPDAGQVLFQDQDVTHLPMYKRARMGMGYLAQEPSVFRNMSVEQNILSILETLPGSKVDRKVRLEELLSELHLERVAKSKASALSGGERRRLEITRALATRPSFLLLDEPFANIDPIAIHDVKEMARMLASKGIGILITDHNAREIFSVVDRCYLVTGGQVMLSGRPDELIASEEARLHYLGENFAPLL
ncbi:MAG: LPS export ABC transporter ATP-binding protein [Parachlamydiales bacterium]